MSDNKAVADPGGETLVPLLELASSYSCRHLSEATEPIRYTEKGDPGRKD